MSAKKDRKSEKFPGHALQPDEYLEKILTLLEAIAKKLDITEEVGK